MNADSVVRGTKFFVGSFLAGSVVHSAFASCSAVDFKKCSIENLDSNSKITSQESTNGKEFRLKWFNYYALHVMSLNKNFYFKIFRERSKCLGKDILFFYNQETASKISEGLCNGVNTVSEIYDLKSKKNIKLGGLKDVSSKDFYDLCKIIEKNIDKS